MRSISLIAFKNALEKITIIRFQESTFYRDNEDELKPFIEQDITQDLLNKLSLKNRINFMRYFFEQSSKITRYSNYYNDDFTKVWLNILDSFIQETHDSEDQNLITTLLTHEEILNIYVKLPNQDFRLRLLDWIQRNKLNTLCNEALFIQFIENELSRPIDEIIIGVTSQFKYQLSLLSDESLKAIIISQHSRFTPGHVNYDYYLYMIKELARRSAQSTTPDSTVTFESSLADVDLIFQSFKAHYRSTSELTPKNSEKIADFIEQYQWIDKALKHCIQILEETPGVKNTTPIGNLKVLMSNLLTHEIDFDSKEIKSEKKNHITIPEIEHQL